MTFYIWFSEINRIHVEGGVRYTGNVLGVEIIIALWDGLTDSHIARYNEVNSF